MYNIDCKKHFEIQLVLPSFGDRLRKLVTSDKTNIVYVKNEFDNSTFRYRTVNVSESLADSKKYNICYFLTDEIPEILKYLDKIDLIIFQRTTWDFNVDRLIHFSKEKNIKLIYDVDDLIYHHKYAPKYMNNISCNCTPVDIRFWLGFTTSYEVVAEKCDEYIVTTPELKKNIISDFNKKTYIISNYLNNEQIKESEYILENRKKDNSKFVIGYFSGSPSHANDFKICENEIVNLLEKYDDIYLKIVGFLDLSDKLKRYVNNGRVFFEDFVPYQELQYKIGSVDLNIIPLVNNTFNDCKSELKFFEAGIVKVPSIASDVDIYKKVNEDGKDIILCEQGKWFKNIEQLYLDREKLNMIAENAYKKTKEFYMPSVMAKRIENVFDDILKNN